MTVNLHLFSTPGGDDLPWIVDACRPYLRPGSDATLAYLPLASLYAERWQEQVETVFHGMASVETIAAELMTQAEMETILRRASAVFVPGGNTFLLNHRLHISGVMPYFRKKVQAGLPLIGFSAGTVICGPNILTSRDLNALATVHFEGLNAIPFNFLVHYALDAHGQSLQDEWLADYHFFHDNTVLMLCDDAYLRVDGRKPTLIRGEAWVLRKGQEKRRLELDEIIAA
jgi:peptidase E